MTIEDRTAWLILLILLYSIFIYSFVENGNAYTISRNKIVYSPIKEIAQNISNTTIYNPLKVDAIPKNLTMSSTDILWLMNVHCDCESFACQGGCYLMRDKILDHFKLKTGYSYQPSKIVKESDLKVCYPYQKGYMEFNNTKLFEFYNESGKKYLIEDLIDKKFIIDLFRSLNISNTTLNRVNLTSLNIKSVRLYEK